MVQAPYILALLLLGGFPLVRGQNLVLNPSFETFTSCPKKLGNVSQDVKFWTTPTQGTTDYFNSCSSSMGVPENFNCSQLAYDGEGYVGLYMYAPEDYREYIQATLSKKLVKEKKYSLSFYVSLAEKSDSYINKFGVLFSEKQLRLPIKKELSKLHLSKLKDNKISFVEITNKKGYSDTNEWMLVNTEFVATGSEQYILIGNFNANNNTLRSKIKKVEKERGSYYYIDMVSVIASNEPDMSDTIQDFKTILFPFDAYQLSKEAKNEIKSIFAFLEENPNFSISVQGHTDTEGNRLYNENLSNRRAEKVADYFIQLGLSKQRIHWQGFGSSQPALENTTDNGRTGNRRVEIVLHKTNDLD